MGKLTEIAEGYTNLVLRSHASLSEGRLRICKRCPHYSIASTCTLCGCYMPAKTRSTNAKCPQDKWL